MLKKTDAFLFSPRLPVRRMVGLVFPMILLLSLMATCQDPVQPEPYPDSDLLLEKLDVSCTEAWLKVSLSGTDSGAATAIPVILTRDGETLNNFSFTPPETLIIDTGLEPARSYQYQVQRQSVHDNKIIDNSNILSVTTLDTTSHDFSWTIDTLGDYGSYFMDVAIIDENNIWAVGNIETDSGSYNAAHWDGERWEFVRIAPEPFLFAPLTAIFAGSGNDVWAAGTAPMSFDGETWSAEATFPTSGWINAIWGSSPEDVWFVGSSGSIVHYDGSGFTRLESGTEANLTDIWGIESSEGFVTVYTSGFLQPVETVILKIEDGISQRFFSRPYSEYIQLNTASISGPVVSIWTDSQYYLWAITYWGLYRIDTNNAQDFTRYPDINAWGGYINCLRGNTVNDLFFGGEHSQMWHFNGASLHPFGNINGDIVIKHIEIRGNFVITVGLESNSHQGIVIWGRRN